MCSGERLISSRLGDRPGHVLEVDRMSQALPCVGVYTPDP